MNIRSISKEDKKAVVALSADELVKICNALYNDNADDVAKNQLYSEMMIARDICQYGHIDDFCLDRIVECRGKGK